MKLIALLFLVAPCYAKNEFCANCYKVDRHCHKLAYLFDLPAEDFGIVDKIGVLRTNNMLFYSFYTQPQSSEIAKTGFINLHKTEINGILYAGKDMHFLAFDIDQENELAYLGSADGIYVLDKYNLLSLAGAKNKGHIYDIAYVKDKLYYIASENQPRRVNELTNPELRVMRFVVKNNNLTVFIANTDKSRLYVTNGRETAVLSSIVHNGLTKDINDVVYSWTDEGVYRIILTNDIHNTTVEKILDIPKIKGLAFDSSNNIIFAIGRALFKLTRNENTVCAKTYLIHCSG